MTHCRAIGASHEVQEDNMRLTMDSSHLYASAVCTEAVWNTVWKKEIKLIQV